MRVIQISDTHLSTGKAQFAANWAPLAGWIAEMRPDLVIHTGDVTVDGADVEEDLRHCAALMRGLGLKFRAVPGNHDVGDAPGSRQSVTMERLARWRAHFGADRWFEDFAGWRLVGIDAMIFGGGPEEADQFAWLEEVMAGASGRRIAWFLHKPLFLENPDEGDVGYWSIRPEPRRKLLKMRQQHDVGLIASGHLHRAHRLTLGPTNFVWAPSSAFLVGPAIQPEMPGEKQLGATIRSSSCSPWPPDKTGGTRESSGATAAYITFRCAALVVLVSIAVE